MDAAEKFELIKALKNQLDEYIQKKADFLAEITTEPLATTKSAFFYRDVIVPFITNTLLTDNLARNEGIGYTDFIHNRLRICVIINGKELKAQFACSDTDPTGQKLDPPRYTYPESLPYTLRCIHEKKNPPGIPDNQLCRNPTHSSIVGNDGTVLHISEFENGNEDVEIELPGPLGEYAFYAFLENLIRNAAKHNKEFFDQDLSRELHIVIRITEPENEKKKDLTEAEKKKKNDFYEVEVFDNVSEPFSKLDTPGGTKKELLTVIQELKDHRIIDEDVANLVRQAWGIAEMKICAMLLKGVIDFKKLEKSLTVKDIEFDGKSRLCYSFDLMKPKKLCVVAPSPNGKTAVSKEDTDKLRQSGIWIFGDIAALKRYIAGSSSIASFRFCLLDYQKSKSTKADTLEDFIHKLPFRIVITHRPDEDISEDLKRLVQCGAAVCTHEPVPYEKGAAQIMSWLWRVWLKRWLKDKETPIVEVFLDQEQELSPSVDWIKHADRFNRAPQNEGLVKVGVRARNAERKVIHAVGDSNWTGRRIFFDRHGGALASLATNEDFFGDHTYIFLDKLNSDFVRIFHPTFPDDRRMSHDDGPAVHDQWLLPYELAEAGMLRILIVDERMAERCLREVSDASTQTIAYHFTRKAFGTPLTWHLAFGAKLYIATHFGFNKAPTPLHQQSYQQAESKGSGLLPFLNVKVEGTEGQPYRITYEWSPNRQKNVSSDLQVDALIIHQGVLDQLKELKSKDFLKDFLTEIRQSIPFIVVDSGRGIPPSLPATAKFLPFSVLQDYVVGKRPAKYGLTQVTMALTRRQREN